MAEEFAPGSFDLGTDAFTGTSQKMHITPDQRLVFETKTDISDLADQNKEIMNSVSRTSRSGDMVKVASLPMLVYVDLMKRGILRDKAAMKKWLQSEEARPYRTHHFTS